MTDVSYDTEQVTEIRWDGHGLSGKLKMQCLPDTLKHFSASGNAFEGPLDLSKLPAGLISLDLSNNAIRQDVVHVGKIPKSLELIDLTGNSIKGVQWVGTETPVDDPRIWF